MNLQTIFLMVQSLLFFFIPRSKTAPVRLAKKQPWRVEHELELTIIFCSLVVLLLFVVAFCFVGQADPWNNGVMA